MLPFTYLVTQIPQFTRFHKYGQVLCLSYSGIYFPIGFDAVVQETRSIFCTSSLGKIWNYRDNSRVLNVLHTYELIAVSMEKFTDT